MRRRPTRTARTPRRRLVAALPKQLVPSISPGLASEAAQHLRKTHRPVYHRVIEGAEFRGQYVVGTQILSDLKQQGDGWRGRLFIPDRNMRVTAKLRLIGEGQIGEAAFGWLLADRRTRGVPLVLETPHAVDEPAEDDAAPDPHDVRMLALLERLARDGAGADAR